MGVSGWHFGCWLGFLVWIFESTENHLILFLQNMAKPYPNTHLPYPSRILRYLVPIFVSDRVDTGTRGQMTYSILIGCLYFAHHPTLAPFLISLSSPPFYSIISSMCWNMMCYGNIFCFFSLMATNFFPVRVVVSVHVLVCGLYL